MMGDENLGRKVKPPYIPTVCHCMNREISTDWKGDKWCVNCGGYCGNDKYD